MSTYLQLGHESWSLLDEDQIGQFHGLILSPVNDDPTYVRNRLERLGESRRNFEVVLDPQMYNPATDKGQMKEWSYFSPDFATADQSDAAWWIERGRRAVDDGAKLGVNAVCSPALFPRVFSNDYYSLMVEIGDATLSYARSNGMDGLLTAVVSLRDLASPARAYDIASILSGSDCDRLYLTFTNDDVPPREPLKDDAGLPTAVHLVKMLASRMRVHVAFAAHDIVLWKSAGAADASTGKWQNVRRFCPGRWREEENGGRQVPYWNEDSLLALLRETDVARLNREGWFAGRNFEDNPASASILQIISDGTGTPWVKLGWLQYLRWFRNVEDAWTSPDDAVTALEDADRAWSRIQEKRILFQERFNTGDHVRAWLNSVREGGSR